MDALSGNLAGKVAVVTGGVRGIGRAISQKLVQKGAIVVVNYAKNDEAAIKTKQLLELEFGACECCKFDVADEEAVKGAFAQIEASIGPVDILINNAGITRDGLILKMTKEDWNAVIDTNLGGAFNCCQAVYRSMMKRRYGRIINISSVVGSSGNAGQGNYSASKAGLEGFTKSLARELASRNVTANCVAPGFISTDMTANLPENVSEKMLSEIPLKRFGSPEDVASAVAFLASEEASYITGQTLHVNGGMYM